MLQEYAVGRSAYSSSSIGPWPDNTVVFEFADGEFSKSLDCYNISSYLTCPVGIS